VLNAPRHEDEDEDTGCLYAAECSSNPQVNLRIIYTRYMEEDVISEDTS